MIPLPLGTIAAAALLCLVTAVPADAAGKDRPSGDPVLKLTAEPVALVAGGKRDGAAYAQQIELNLKPDLGKLTGIEGLSAHVTFVNRFGENASAKLAGDTLFQSQAVVGGTRHAPVHLVQAYLEEDLGKLNLAAGRLPTGEAFAQSPLYCRFMNTAICGYPHSLPSKEGFTAFPNSTWGARVRVSPSRTFSLQTGAYQVRPKLGGKYGFDWGWSGTTGVYLPVELAWEPSLGTAGLSGHYKVGAAYDTSDYDDNFLDRAGRSYVLSGARPRKRSSRHSVYVLADQMLARHGEGEENGLVALAGFVHSDPRTSQIDRFAFAGLADQGLFAARPDDKAGLVVAYAKISDSLTRTQRLQRGLALPLAQMAGGVQSHEIVVEADYEAKIDAHLSVMPDLQYLIRPGATEANRNALLVGMRVTAQF